MTNKVGLAGRHVDKPWGHELIWTHTDRYVGKVIAVRAGERLSLQLHNMKDESIFVMKGLLCLHLQDENGDLQKIKLGPGEFRHVPTGAVHRFEAIEDVELLEVSTTELDDVVRLEDDYGREDSASS